jgi:hypothetical protein
MPLNPLKGTKNIEFVMKEIAVEFSIKRVINNI